MFSMFLQIDLYSVFKSILSHTYLSPPSLFLTHVNSYVQLQMFYLSNPVKYRITGT